MTTQATPVTDHATPGQAANTRRIDVLLSHYGTSHTHPTNELIHFVAIPAIVLSALGMLYVLHPWVAYAVVGLSMVYYARLSWPFFVAMGVSSLAMLVLVYWVAQQGILWQAALATFVVAWIFQFIGHKIEGKKPSFFEDLQYLLVGPLFVLSKLFVKLGIRW